MTETYTLEQAQRKLAQMECANGGHAPSVEVRDMVSALGEYLCDCMDVRWTPTAREDAEPSRREG